jgi:tetraacyldisaccharide 4'-kinase
VRWEEVQAGGGGALGVFARAGLGVLAVGWGGAWGLKQAAYALRLRRGARLPVPVLSVGNLQVGGTGKTPFAAWLVRGLQARGRRPGILSRGYGPPAAGAGAGLSDEGAVLRHLLGPGVPQIEDPDRGRGGRRLLAAHPGTDVLVLDDAFQHRRLARDLDLVLLDATRPFSRDRLFPRGRLREPPRALRRAGVVVLTRAERAPPAALEDLAREVARRTPAPVVVVATRPSALESGGERLPPAALAGRRVLAACGIGNPEAFAALLADLGATVVARRFLPDHAVLGPGDAEAFRTEAARAGADLVVVTRKDAVKWDPLPAGIAVLDVETGAVRGEEELWAAVEAALRR